MSLGIAHYRSASSLRKLSLAFVIAISLGSASCEALSRSVDAAAQSPSQLAGETVAFDAQITQRPQMPGESGLTRLVTSCADSGAGSLRSVIAQCQSGDTVDLSHLTCSKITLTTGDIAFTVDSLNINGPGADALVISASNKSDIFEHLGYGVLELYGMTIADGTYQSSTDPTGGCVYSRGWVNVFAANLRNCTLVGDGTVAVRGGALFAKGSVSMLFSNVTGSGAFSLGEAGAFGGGVYAGSDFMAKYSNITDDTAMAIKADQAGYGGGVWAVDGGSIGNMTIARNLAQDLAGIVFLGRNPNFPISVAESTISGNISTRSRFGSGLFVGHDASVINSTIANNTEDNLHHRKYGAGISAVDGSVITLDSTILSGNVIAGTTRYDDIGAHGSLAGSHNLMRFSQLPYPQGTLLVDPKLGPLANNGGPTFTHALLPGSPAIDAGSFNDPDTTFDQRGVGYPRVIGIAADIGAVEH